ncbi:hypothetical protein TYRP_004169 [Tyrophagus putrescentiae]|nr:hypothetical protein TYRP_004169 [Tyrophagus putrescentiae]
MRVHRSRSTGVRGGVLGTSGLVDGLRRHATTVDRRITTRVARVHIVRVVDLRLTGRPDLLLLVVVVVLVTLRGGRKSGWGWLLLMLLMVGRCRRGGGGGRVRLPIAVLSIGLLLLLLVIGNAVGITSRRGSDSVRHPTTTSSITARRRLLWRVVLVMLLLVLLNSTAISLHIVGGSGRGGVVAGSSVGFIIISGGGGGGGGSCIEPPPPPPPAIPPMLELWPKCPLILPAAWSLTELAESSKRKPLRESTSEAGGGDLTLSVSVCLSAVASAFDSSYLRSALRAAIQFSCDCFSRAFSWPRYRRSVSSSSFFVDFRRSFRLSASSSSVRSCPSSELASSSFCSRFTSCTPISRPNSSSLSLKCLLSTSSPVTALSRSRSAASVAAFSEALLRCRAASSALELSRAASSDLTFAARAPRSSSVAVRRSCSLTMSCRSETEVVVSPPSSSSSFSLSSSAFLLAHRGEVGVLPVQLAHQSGELCLGVGQRRRLQLHRLRQLAAALLRRQQVVLEVAQLLVQGNLRRLQTGRLRLQQGAALLRLLQPPEERLRLGGHLLALRVRLSTVPSNAAFSPSSRATFSSRSSLSSSRSRFSCCSRVRSSRVVFRREEFCEASLARPRRLSISLV